MRIPVTPKKIIRFWKSLAFYKQARKDGSSNLDMSLSSPSHNSLTTYIRVNCWRLLLMSERHILCNSRDVWNIIVTVTRHSSKIFTTNRTRLPLVVKKFTFTCQSYFPILTVGKVSSSTRITITGSLFISINLSQYVSSYVQTNFALRVMLPILLCWSTILDVKFAMS